MDKKTLFLHTLEDLENKLNSNKAYDILKGTELVRTLLFDASGPLVDKINKEFKLKIKFVHKDTEQAYVNISSITRPSFYISLDGFYPKHSLTNSKTIESNRNDFFNTMVIVINDKRFTVKDILDHVINCLGGTHHFDSKTDEQKTLKELESYYFGGIEANSLIKQSKSIGYVVLDALDELKNEVIKKYY